MLFHSVAQQSNCFHSVAQRSRFCPTSCGTALVCHTHIGLERACIQIVRVCEGLSARMRVSRGGRSIDLSHRSLVLHGMMLWCFGFGLMPSVIGRCARPPGHPLGKCRYSVVTRTSSFSGLGRLREHHVSDRVSWGRVAIRSRYNPDIVRGHPRYDPDTIQTQFVSNSLNPCEALETMHLMKRLCVQVPGELLTVHFLGFVLMSCHYCIGILSGLYLDRIGYMSGSYLDHVGGDLV